MIYSSIKISTTGLDRVRDELLRFVAIEFEVDDTLKPYQSKILKTVDIFIKPEVEFEVDSNFNSFTKEDVLETGFTFSPKVADRLRTYIEGKNITGFNVDNFDLAFLYSYFRRHTVKLDLSNTRTFDTMYIDSKLYPRNFEGTYKRYTGRVIGEEFTKNALLVAQSNMDIFSVEFIQSREQGFLKDIGLPVLSPEHLIEERNDSVVFCNGKYQYKDVADICLQDPGYVEWLFSFATQVTKESIQEYFYKKYPEKLKK